jgi:exo-beta-1,3-glucanase (GH17 family)
VDGNNAFAAMWRVFDWTGWLKPQIDDAAKVGNCIRIWGSPMAITLGNVTQATYLARWKQLLDYAVSIGLYVYPCGGSLGQHWGPTTDSQALTIYAAWADLLRTYPKVVGVDITNEAMAEMQNNFAKLPLLINLGNTVRARGIPVAHSLPITDTNWWAWDGGTVFPIRQLCEASDFIDAHDYADSTPAQANSILSTAWGSGKNLVIGEFGYNTQATSAARTARYARIKTVVDSGPQHDGALAWSCWDLNGSDTAWQFGLFNGSRQLRTDISTPFATFSITR